MRWISILLVLISFGATPAYEPTSSYEKREIRGWTIYANKSLLFQKEHAAKVLELLDVKLFDVERALPAEAFRKLRDSTPIWLETVDPRHPGACYHPSERWLRDNGFNPEKAGAVQINATNFLSWSKDQPYMVLHELAHAYHHKVAGYDDQTVAAAYKSAKESGKYDKVLRINGKTAKHYALNNSQEYFAELSESYFGTNDFYPFVRGELKEHDPAGYAMIEKVWGLNASRTP
jgi:hypothetical protein